MAKLSLKEINTIAGAIQHALGWKNREANGEDFAFNLATVIANTLGELEVNAHFSDVEALRNDFIFRASGEIPHTDPRVANPEMCAAFYEANNHISMGETWEKVTHLKEVMELVEIKKQAEWPPLQKLNTKDLLEVLEAPPA